MTPQEVSGYSGEALELSQGKFRYWFYSDVVTGDEPTYPLTGEYQLTDNALFMAHDEINRPWRTGAVVNGVDVLWRKDGYDLWQSEQRVHPYAVLIRVGDAPGDASTYPRPSLYALYTGEMRTRDAKEYVERFNDQPPEVRALLRAATLEGDSQLTAYTAEIRKAWKQLDPKLVNQLVSLMGHDKPHRIRAERILERLYVGDALIFKDDQPFLGDEKKIAEALHVLVEALSSATERDALEKTLMILLRASGNSRIDLPIPEAGVRVRLEYRADGAQSYGSEALEGSDQQPTTVDWKAEMPAVIRSCQAWCLEKLED